KLWDVKTGELVAKIDEKLGEKDVTMSYYSVAFTPDGQAMAVAEDYGTVTVWDPGRSRKIATLKGHEPLFVLAVAITPDGKTLVSAGGDKKILLWNVAAIKGR